MELNILDQSYTLIKVIDMFDSLVWTVRYNEVGEFEIKAIVDMDTAGLSDMLGYLAKDNYATIRESDRMMIIESVTYTSDHENGDSIVSTGRSLESLLDRRIINGHVTITGSLQDGILRLLNENIINPSDENRKIIGFSMKMSEDETITSITTNSDFTGDNLLDAIIYLCQTANIGFRVLPDFDNIGYIFELYKGTDRTYDQDVVAPVVFSPKFENLINSNYVDSNEKLKNFAYVENENEGIKIEVFQGETPPKDLYRREMYVSSSISPPEVEAFGTGEDEVDLSDEENGHWETTVDRKRYERDREKVRKEAEERVEKAGGEANMDWPPPGREGQSYVDWCVSRVTIKQYTTSVYIEGPNYNQSAEEKEAEQLAKYNEAVAQARTFAENQMREEGLKTLSDNRIVQAFDGEIVNYFQFVAGRDYFLGDVVQMINNLFVNVKTRFTELTFTEDSSGMHVIPSFLTDTDMNVKEGL